jgi:hypothetical protein
MQEFEIEKVNKWDYRRFLFHCALLLLVVAGCCAALVKQEGGEAGDYYNGSKTVLGVTLISAISLLLYFAYYFFYSIAAKGASVLYIKHSAVGFNRSVDALLLANQHLLGFGVIKDEAESARLLQVAAEGFKKAARESRDPDLCYKVSSLPRIGLRTSVSPRVVT